MKQSLCGLAERCRRMPIGPGSIHSCGRPEDQSVSGCSVLHILWRNSEPTSVGIWTASDRWRASCSVTPPVKRHSRQDGCAARQEMAVQAERFGLWAAGDQDLRGVASLPAKIEPVIIVDDLLSLAEYLPKPIFSHKSDDVTVARETSAKLLDSRVLC